MPSQPQNSLETRVREKIKTQLQSQSQAQHSSSPFFVFLFAPRHRHRSPGRLDLSVSTVDKALPPDLASAGRSVL
jgi:hypothetical protein